jgi:hypothetical protein
MTITATFSPSAQLLSKLGTRIPSKARTRSHMASMADFYASLKRAADVLGQCALEETSGHTAVVLIPFLVNRPLSDHDKERSERTTGTSGQSDI